jgi:hypothetical protein
MAMNERREIVRVAGRMALARWEAQVTRKADPIKRSIISHLLEA